MAAASTTAIAANIEPRFALGIMVFVLPLATGCGL
jgi:hypothetical protein